MRRALSLPVYRRLLVAYGMNELCWSVGTLALTVLVYRRTGTALGAAAFFVVSMVLPALIAPPLVLRLDRLPVRRLLPALYAVEAGLFAILAWMAGHFLLVPVLALALLDGVVAAAARSFARAATTAVLMPVDLLREGNALANGVFSITYMGGPALGGLVVATGGTAAALLVNCGLFAAIAVLLVTTALSAGEQERPPERFRQRLRAAAVHVRQRADLKQMLWLQAAGVLFFTIATPVEVVFADHTLHAGPAGYGVLLSAWGAGAVAGSLAYARWRRMSNRALMSAAAASIALGYAVLAAAPNLGVALVGAALGGAANGIELVVARTALQEHTDQGWMALVMSLFDSVSQLAPGAGILLGGVVGQLAGPRAAFALAAVGAGLFTGAVWLALAPARLARLEARGAEAAAAGAATPAPAGGPADGGDPPGAPVAATARETTGRRHPAAGGATASRGSEPGAALR